MSGSGAPQGAVLLAAAAGQGGEADHEEVQPGEGDQVNRQLAQVRVQLPCSSHRNSQARFVCKAGSSNHARHES